MYGLFAKKMAVVERQPLVEVSLYIELKRYRLTPDVMSNFSLISQGNLSGEARSPREVTEVFHRKPLANKQPKIKNHTSSRCQVR